MSLRELRRPPRACSYQTLGEREVTSYMKLLGGVRRLVAVSHPRLGDQPARPRRVGLELAPQLRHVEPQVAARVAVPGPPHVVEQLAVAEQLARVAQQHLEQVPFGGRQPDLSVLMAFRPGLWLWCRL